MVDKHAFELEKINEQLRLEVAELRWKEEALRESEKRFRNIALSMVVWIWETDEKGVYTYCSERVQDILGYTPDEMTGRNFIDLMPPKAAQRFRKEFNEVSENKKIIKDFENWNLHKNGSHICLVTNGVPILDEDGELKGYRGVHKDITEQKRAEEALKEANRKLKKFDRLKSDFVSMVSHEIRTPITIMREGISLCLDRVIGEITTTQKEVLADTLEHIDRLGRLVTDLLDLSKIEEGKIELRRSLVDLCEIVKKIQKNFEKYAHDKDICIYSNVPSQPLHNYVDKDKIIQIFHNLINNAIRHTKPGGKIKIQIEEKHDLVLCCVSDTGVGISEENLTRLFSKFEQFGRKEDPKNKGTGLGLAIAKGLVDKHGGEIWAESELGKGTIFYFTLKKVSPPSILVFHDRQSPSNRIKNALKGDGYHMIETFDLGEMVDLTQKRMPSLIILNTRYEHMDALDVIEQLKQENKDLQQPFLVLNQNNHPEGLVRRDETKNDICFIDKSITGEALKEKVMDLLAV